MKNLIISFTLLILVIVWLLIILSVITNERAVLICSIVSVLILSKIIFSTGGSDFPKFLGIIVVAEFAFVLTLNFVRKKDSEIKKTFLAYSGFYEDKSEYGTRNGGCNYYLCYNYYDSYGKKKHTSIQVDSKNYYSKMFDTLKVSLVSPVGFMKSNLTEIDEQKYKFPVQYYLKYEELGNNSFDYAKFAPLRAYENFGLNIVYMTHTADSKYIYFDDVLGRKQKIEDSSVRDTFLVYSNINPKFFDGWHVCPDNICTSENFAKIEEGGYGYIFRGRIYSKDETEKYWNIIEQYKLREGVKKE